jgi:hypothetical protein
VNGAQASRTSRGWLREPPVVAPTRGRQAMTLHMDLIQQPDSGRLRRQKETHMAQGRRINWLNVITVISAAILIGAEVFGAAFAGSWAIATLFDLGSFGARVLDVVFVLCGFAIMAQFIRAAHRIEPFTSRG